MGHDSCGLGKRRVPLVDQGFNSLHLRGQFTVIPHLFENIKNGLSPHLTDGKNAHTRDEHVHLLLDERG